MIENHPHDSTKTQNIKPPRKTTPADIEASPFCVDITGHLLVRAEFSPDDENYFLDCDSQISPAQEYSIMLRKVAKRVSTFLERKGKSAVADYPEAQRAYLEHRSEPWFGELDELFSQSLIELGNPSLARVETLTAEARAQDILSLTARLARCDRPSFFLSLQYLLHRIDTTERLMRYREMELHAFGVATANSSWNTPKVWLEHSQRIHAGLERNLQALCDERKRHFEYGIEHGWLNPDRYDPT